MTSSIEGQKVRETISLTGQFAALDPNLTARENLQLMVTSARPQPRRGRAHHRSAARALRCCRVRGPARQAAVRWAAAPHRPGRRAGRDSRSCWCSTSRRRDLIRAAARSSGRRCASSSRTGITLLLDHPVPGGGRRAGRPHRADRPRPRDRQGHALGAEGAGRRPARGRHRGRLAGLRTARARAQLAGARADAAA